MLCRLVRPCRDPNALRYAFSSGGQYEAQRENTPARKDECRFIILIISTWRLLSSTACC